MSRIVPSREDLFDRAKSLCGRTRAAAGALELALAGFFQNPGVAVNLADLDKAYLHFGRLLSEAVDADRQAAWELLQEMAAALLCSEEAKPNV